MAIVIEAVLFAPVVTVLPYWSWTLTVTAGLMDWPTTVLLGCCPKVSWVAAPGVMLKLLLVTPVSPLLAAFSVQPLLTLCTARSLKAAAPLLAPRVVVPLSVAPEPEQEVP